MSKRGVSHPKRPDFLAPNQAIKVLRGGMSFHGAKDGFKWKLPVPASGKLIGTPGHITMLPGDWMPKIGKVSPCYTGYHLTYNPAQWWEPNSKCRAYVAEYRGRVRWNNNRGLVKMAVAECRLIRELTDAELKQFGILHSGTHNPADLDAIGIYRAAGRMSDRPSIYVGGSARLSYTGPMTRSIEFYGQSTGHVDGTCGNARVVIHERANVDVYGQADLRLKGGRAKIYGTSRAFGVSGTIVVHGDAYVSLDGPKARTSARNGRTFVDGGAKVTIAKNCRAFVVAKGVSTVRDMGRGSIIEILGEVRPTIDMAKGTVVIDKGGAVLGGNPKVYTSANPYPNPTPPVKPEPAKRKRKG